MSMNLARDEKEALTVFRHSWGEIELEYPGERNINFTGDNQSNVRNSTSGEEEV